MALRNIVLLSKNVAKTTAFYHKAIGLQILHQTEEMSELHAGPINIVIKEAENAGQLATGYSPILTFQVANMETSITEAMQLDAYMDGPMLYPAHGKFASIRSPEGVMIGLFELSDIDLNNNRPVR